MSRRDDRVTLRQMLDQIEDHYILWNIVAEDFPPLASQIKAMLQDQQS